MVNISIIGDSKVGKTSLATKLGKKGTDSDITFYNNIKHDQKYVFIEPKTYPKTLKSIISSINLSEIVVLCIEIGNITKYIGECIVLLNSINIKYGLIVITKTENSYNLEISNFINKVEKLIYDTNIQNWPIIPINTIKDCSNPFNGIDKINNYLNDYYKYIEEDIKQFSTLKTRVVIDHFFNVTGIGTVILGKVLQGNINIHDKLTLYPINKKVEIKSIQKNDINVKSASTYDRVGIGLKGILEKDLERGFLISEEEIIDTTIQFSFTPSKYMIGTISKNDLVHLFIGLQNDAVIISKIESESGDILETIDSNNKDNNHYYILTCKLNKYFSYNENDLLLLAKLENKQRILGTGYVKKYKK